MRNYGTKTFLLIEKANHKRFIYLYPWEMTDYKAIPADDLTYDEKARYLQQGKPLRFFDGEVPLPW